MFHRMQVSRTCSILIHTLYVDVSNGKNSTFDDAQLDFDVMNNVLEQADVQNTVPERSTVCKHHRNNPRLIMKINLKQTQPKKTTVNSFYRS